MSPCTGFRQNMEKGSRKQREQTDESGRKKKEQSRKNCVRWENLMKENSVMDKQVARDPHVVLIGIVVA